MTEEVRQLLAAGFALWLIVMGLLTVVFPFLLGLDGRGRRRRRRRR